MQLGELSDIDLVAQIRSKCRKEHRFVAEIVAYLAEVEKRDLHREMGSSSLYNFCIHKLGMSEGTAFRRMTAARLVGDFPALLPRIKDGRLHLAGLVLLKPYFTKENIEELADAASGLSEARIKLLIATLYPAPDVQDDIRPAASTPAQMPLKASPAEAHSPAPVAELRGRTKPLSPTKYLVQMTVSAETHEKLARARDLLRHRLPDGNLAAVVDRALDALLAKLERERLGAAKRPRKEIALADPADVSRAARRAVFERDGEQCTYCGPDGERCAETGLLELDHVTARALGGLGYPDNLRVVCGPHNRYLAAKLFGKVRVSRKKAGRIKATTPPPPAVVLDSAEALHEKGGETSSPAESTSGGGGSSARAAADDEARAIYGLADLGFPRSSCVRVVRDIMSRGDPSLSLRSLLREAIGTLAAQR